MMNDGVGKLLLTQAEGPEAIKLKSLYHEVADGHLGFWTCLMWAYQNKKLTKNEEAAVGKLFDRLKPEYQKLLDRKPKAKRKAAKL